MQICCEAPEIFTETSPDFTSVWGWVDKDWILFFGVNCPLKLESKLIPYQTSVMPTHHPQNLKAGEEFAVLHHVLLAKHIHANRPKRRADLGRVLVSLILLESVKKNKKNTTREIFWMFSTLNPISLWPVFAHSSTSKQTDGNALLKTKLAHSLPLHPTIPPTILCNTRPPHFSLEATF